MISMAVLTPFFDVVAGVAILAGRSSLLDAGIFKTANNNFTVRQLLALGFIGYGGWNLWKMERAQDKLKKTLDAESFSAESGDKPSCGHAECMDFGMDGWLSDRAIVMRYYTQWFNGVGEDEFFAYTGSWKPILALNALSPEDMKDIANTERDVVGCYREGFNAETFAAEDKCDCGADLQYMSGDLLDDGNFFSRLVMSKS